MKIGLKCNKIIVIYLIAIQTVLAMDNQDPGMRSYKKRSVLYATEVFPQKQIAKGFSNHLGLKQRCLL